MTTSLKGTCPITLESPPKVPVFDACGHMYEREAIEEWFKNNDTCPCTGLVVTSKMLSTERPVKGNSNQPPPELQPLVEVTRRRFWPLPHFTDEQKLSIFFILLSLSVAPIGCWRITKAALWSKHDCVVTETEIATSQRRIWTVVSYCVTEGSACSKDRVFTRFRTWGGNYEDESAKRYYPGKEVKCYKVDGKFAVNKSRRNGLISATLSVGIPIFIIGVLPISLVYLANRN